MDCWIQIARENGSTPQMRTNLRWCQHIGKHRSWWILSDPITNRNFRCDEVDARFLQLLDGRRSLIEAQNELQREFPLVECSLQRLAAIASFARSNQWLVPNPAQNVSVYHRNNQISQAPNPIRKTLAEFRKLLLLIAYQRVSIGNPNRIASWVARRTQWLFGPSAVTLWIAFIVVSLVAALLASHQWTNANFEEAFSFTSIRKPSLWVGAIVVFVVTRLLHEAAHATACVREGSQCNDCGFMRILCIAFPYVDVTEAWKIANRPSRMMVYAAGIYVDLIVAALAIWVWLATPSGYVDQLAFITMLLCTVTSLFFNANPLMKYDGYYLLCESLEVADVQIAAKKAWLDSWQRWSGHNAYSQTRSQYRWSKSLQLILQAYHPVSIGYRIMLTCGILLGALATFHAWHLAELGWMVTSSAIILSLGMAFDRNWNRTKAQQKPSFDQQDHRKSEKAIFLMRTLVGCIALLGFVIAVLIPVPQRIYAKGNVITSGRSAVYSTVPGTALTRFENSAGTTIQLDRTCADQELSRLQKSVDEIDAKKQILQKAAFFDAGLLHQLPQLETVRNLRIQRIQRLQKQFNAYTISLSESECFLPIQLAGFDRAANPQDINKTFHSKLEKYPTVASEMRQGSFIQQGTHIGYRCPMDREAIVQVLLPQEHRAEVYVGQNANVRILQNPFRTYAAKVTAISQLIRNEESSKQEQQTGSVNIYQVHLQIEQPETLKTFIENGNAEVVFKARGKNIYATARDYLSKMFR